jgi:predicted hydrolase (HD superfamily)
MTRAEKKYVIAWTYAQAKHYAQSIMRWKCDEWVYVNDTYRLRGLYGILMYDVRAPRYEPEKHEIARMEAIQQETQIMNSAGRIARLNVVNLP